MGHGEGRLGQRGDMRRATWEKGLGGRNAM